MLLIFGIIIEAEVSELKPISFFCMCLFNNTCIHLCMTESDNNNEFKHLIYSKTTLTNAIYDKPIIGYTVPLPSKRI